MASVDLTGRHLFAAAALLGLLVGGVAGLFFPIRAATPPKSSRDTWSLPTALEARRYRDDAFATLRAARIWSDVATTGQRGAPAVTWTLSAIITRPSQMAAVSGKGAQKQALVAVGGALPDGSTLVRMSRDAVWFEKDGCLRERRLYRAVTAENDACIGESKTEQPPAPAANQNTTAPARPRPAASPATPAGGTSP